MIATSSMKHGRLDSRRQGLTSHHVGAVVGEKARAGAGSSPQWLQHAIQRRGEYTGRKPAHWRCGSCSCIR